MAYNLWTQGIQDVDRIIRLFNKQERSHEPVSGLVDGVNQFFYIQYTPVLASSTISVYTSGSVPLASSAYSLDGSSGLLIMNTAPSVQPSVSYETARYSDLMMRSLLIAGFDEMELQWFRGLTVSQSIGSVTLVDESSGSAYITDNSGNTPVAIDGTPFDQSRQQIGFYTKCVQLAYLKSLLPESALGGYLWAEAGGLKVDKSRVPQNLKLALDVLTTDLNDMKQNAQFEWFGDQWYGGAIAPPYTQDFVAHRWWQKDSMAKNIRVMQPYIGDRW